MDILSITVSVTALATLCGQVVILCNNIVGRRHSMNRTLISLRTEIFAYQASLHTIQDLLLDQSGPLAKYLSTNVEWARSFDTTLSACSLTFSILATDLQNAIEESTGSLIKYTLNEHEIKSLIGELRGQQGAVQLLIQTLQLKSITDVIQLLEAKQDVFSSVKKQTAAQSEILRENCNSSHDQGFDTFSIFSLDIDDRRFDFDEELSQLAPYRRVLREQQRQQRAYEDHETSPTGNLLDEDLVDLSHDAPTLGRWSKALQDEFFPQEPLDIHGITVEEGHQSLGMAEPNEGPQLKPVLNLPKMDELSNQEETGAGDGVEDGTSERPTSPHSFLAMETKSTETLLSKKESLATISTFPTNGCEIPKDAANMPPLEMHQSGSRHDFPERPGSGMHIGPIFHPQTIEDTRDTEQVHYAAYHSNNAQLRNIFKGIQSKEKRRQMLSHRIDDKAPIHLAIIGGHLDTTKLLVELGSPLRQLHLDGLTPDQLAVFLGHRDIFEYLHPFSKTPDPFTLYGIVKSSGQKMEFPGWTCLSLAAFCGHFYIVNYILKSKISMNYASSILSRTPRLVPPLHAAVASAAYLVALKEFYGFSDLKRSARFPDLFECSNRYTVIEQHGYLWRSYDESATTMRLKIIDLLCESGYRDLRDFAGFTAIDAACCGNSTAVVKRLLDQAKITVTIKSKPKGYSMKSQAIVDPPLCLAAFWNRASIINLLLREGAAFVDHKGLMSRSALHYAAVMGNLQAIEMLLLWKTNVDCKARSDSIYTGRGTVTPLSLAMARLQLNAMKVLIKAGADVKQSIYVSDILNPNDGSTCELVETILHRAIKQDQDMKRNLTATDSVVKFLLDYGADVNCTNGVQRTPLHLLCTYSDYPNRKAILELLFERKANPNTTDHLGRTPLHSAVELVDYSNGDVHKTVEILLRNGANPRVLNRLCVTPLKVAEDALTRIKKGSKMHVDCEMIIGFLHAAM